MSFDPETIVPPGAKIKVIGIGGGGGNAVNTMIRSSLDGVEFIAANTDIQALRFSLAKTKIQIGRELTKGLGAGADPDIGRDAALEDRHALQEVLAESDMVFITAGMGGGTGTGGAAVVAQIARELGALTVGVVTKPFNFEGKRRKKHAEAGIARLRESVDTLITIPNQRLLQIATPDLSMIDAFRMADNVLVNAVRGISDIINVPGTINVDFADVKTVMSSMGLALMGIGYGQGEGRAVSAARQAIQSPLLEDVDIEGATGILINITAGSSVTLMEVNEACSIIQEAAHEDANIIFGAVIDENMADSIRVTVIATGFPSETDETDSSGREHGAVANFIVSPPRPIITSPYGVSPSGRPRTYNPYPARPTAPAPQAKPATPSITTTPSTVAAPAPAKAAEPTKTASEMAFDGLMQNNPMLSNLASTPSRPMAQESTDLLPKISMVSEAQDLAQWTLSNASEPGRPVATETKVFQFEEETRIEGASVIQDEAEAFADAEDAASHNTEQALPLESMFDKNEAPRQGGSFDQRIDEALELAERLKSTGTSALGSDDDLDVPAFLRNGIKDLSLT